MKYKNKWDIKYIQVLIGPTEQGCETSDIL